MTTTASAIREGVTTASLGRAWEIGTPMTPVGFYPRSGPLPAVVAVHGQTGAWDSPGQTRRLELSGGGQLVETLVTSGTMTNRVDRLTSRGLVERRPDPDDRRSIRVRLTPAGSAVVDAALADLVRAEHQMLDVLPREERRALATLLRRVSAPFE